MITCQNLSLVHDNKIVFQRLNFTLFHGCFIINGSGGRCFLHVIARLLQESNGSILYNGCNVDSNLGEYYTQISYLPQYDFFDEELTAEQNLSFWASIYNSKINIPAACAVFSLEGILKKNLKNLSLEERKCLMLALLILSYSKLWLLDEPFYGLGESSTIHLSELLKAKCFQGGCILMTNKYGNEISQTLLKKEINFINLDEYCYNFTLIND